MTFHIGQRVECVRDDWIGDSPVHPRLGGIYVIRRISLPDSRGDTYLSLVEIPRLNGDEHTWMSDAFRPLLKRETDIAIFRSLLTPAREREKERA